MGQTYVEGVLLMLLRRLLEERIALPEAERVLSLACADWARGRAG